MEELKNGTKARKCAVLASATQATTQMRLLNVMAVVSLSTKLAMGFR